MIFFIASIATANAEPESVEAPVKRLALVVGNASYLNADVLLGSITDARRMAEKLKATGFEVTLAEDVATRADFLNRYFLDFLDKIEEGSFVVFYFSGHGFTYGGESYLAPLQFPKSVPSAQVFTTFISASALQDRINLKNPGLLVMFLDACRNIGGFIDSSAGGPSDIEKGLVGLAAVQNNIIGYASAPGKVSTGNAAGALSKYTDALVAHLPTADEEFDRSHKAVIADVRKSTSNAQNPWISASSTLEVYFNPTSVVTTQFKDAWMAALQSDTPEAVTNYLNLFGLGPFAAAARKWLADHLHSANTFTQFSPAQIDALWDTAQTGVAIGTRITGPFGLSRISDEKQPQIYATSYSDRTKLQKDPRQVASVLTGNQSAIVLEPTLARVRPDAGAPVADSFSVGSKIMVSSTEDDDKGGVWLKASSENSPVIFYVPVPPTAGTLNVPLGRALREFDLDPPDRGSAGIANQQTIAKVLQELATARKEIRWVSISIPANDADAKRFGGRGALLLRSRAYHGAYLLSKTIPRGKITIVDSANFSSDNPRVRIFGK
jgi:hypothetical protein